MSDLDATLIWSRAPVLAAGAFETPLELLGSRFIAPAVDYTAANVSFGGSSLPTLPPVQRIAIDSKFKVTAPAGLKLTIAPVTGLFSGSFLERGTTKLKAFKGALFQKTDLGKGLFKSPPGANGFIELQAVP